MSIPLRTRTALPPLLGALLLLSCCAAHEHAPPAPQPTPALTELTAPLLADPLAELLSYRFDLTAHDQPRSEVLLRLSQLSGVSIMLRGEIDGRLTLALQEVTLGEALEACLHGTDYRYEWREGSLWVGDRR